MERARRLRKGDEFDTVYQKGTVVSGPLLVLRHHPNAGGPTRWGFAVGKRISKKATDRNLIKRRLREAARQIPTVEGHDIVVTARNGTLRASFADLDGALRKQLKRADLLEESMEC